MGPPRGADFYRTRYGVKDAIEFKDLDEVEADLQVGTTCSAFIAKKL